MGELAQELTQRRPYTPPNSRGIPPERITSRSSMLSAPAAIPAMIEVSFPAGFTPAEATFDTLNLTRCPISSDSPARSARAITGTRPAHDTKCSSSNTGVARDHTSGNFTLSAFWTRCNQELHTPDSPNQKAHQRPDPPSYQLPIRGSG